MDTLESHSRLNNLRIYSIRSELNDTWEVTEQRVRNFIKDELDMPDQEHVEIVRAHKLGSKHSDRSPIIVKFGKYKDKDMILNQARQRFERDSPFSVKEDFTERVLKHRKILGERLAEERAKVLYARLNYDKLIVDGQT